ncbi:hypothetical protein [Neolewinella persica]|uniref:hypothetical protein n=1 Tax=Neolewinella persica TaxID=70998 RepID=UPI000399D71C|nr:hypothetical protein [Neolewinella persica]
MLQHRKPVSGGEAIFLIDLKTGRTARLRSELFSQPDDFLTLQIEGNELLLKGTLPGNSKEASPSNTETHQHLMSTVVLLTVRR